MEGGGRRRRFLLLSPRFLSEVQHGSLETVKALLMAGANVNQEDKWGWTALFLPVKKRKTSRQKNDPVLRVRGSQSE